MNGELSEYHQAFAHGLLQAGPIERPNLTPYVLVPQNAQVHDLERLSDRPRRIRQHVNLVELESFMRYVNTFKNDSTVLFAWLGQKLEAILDYHSPQILKPELSESEKPSWCNHVADYNVRHTDEYARWRASHERWMNQEQFAEFIEMNVKDIVEPTGATMLEIATTLHARTEVAFVSGVRLQNNTSQLRFEEHTAANAGERGNLSIPYGFKLGLPIYQGGPPYAVPAFLRYKIENKKLMLRYVLVNPDMIERDAFKHVIEEAEAGTGLKAYV